MLRVERGDMQVEYGNKEEDRHGRLERKEKNAGEREIEKGVIWVQKKNNKE